MEKKIEEYLQINTNFKSERNRTINLPDSIHSFYKNLSNNLNVQMGTVVNNILDDWREKHSEEAKKLIIKNINKRL